MLKIGEFNDLTILRDTSAGLFLGNEAGDEVLLPGQYIPAEFEIGDDIRVFVYRDSEDRPVATNITPKIQLNGIAALQVMAVSKYGAFLDWGLEKDLLAPFSEQLEKMHKGEFYLVYLYLDPASDRLVASSNLPRIIKNRELTVAEGDQVDLIMGEKSDLGIKVIINQKHWGLVYFNEVFANIKLGENRIGYIHKIREDNKIDVRLETPGYSRIEPNAQKVLDKLHAQGGFLALTDKSTPEEISLQLEMSKKVFKKAVGALYKKKLITLKPDGIYFNS
ncbi:MAG: GntR family transcriptional regulator [Saprospiraceae bacterium]|nr:GntR family transcriptional regulator [Saprospiraceae bacterium]